MKAEMEKLSKTIEYLNKNLHGKPEIGIVLGSGLGDIVNSMENRSTIPYNEIPFFPISTVAGHKSQLVAGTIAAKNIVCMQGRFHFYEGYTLKQVVYPIRAMKMLGVSTLVVTNAAGGVNPYFEAGDIMLIRDHINLLPDNPLRGENYEELGPRFPPMANAYNKQLIELARKMALSLDIHLKEGVYVALQGPSLETPAEYNFVRSIGGDAVGMSTVPEVISAVHMGIKVLGFSIITNALRKSQEQGTTHEEVLKAAAGAGKKLSKLIHKIVENYV